MPLDQAFCPAPGIGAGKEAQKQGKEERKRKVWPAPRKGFKQTFKLEVMFDRHPQEDVLCPCEKRKQDKFTEGFRCEIEPALEFSWGDCEVCTHWDVTDSRTPDQRRVAITVRCLSCFSLPLSSPSLCSSDWPWTYYVAEDNFEPLNSWSSCLHLPCTGISTASYSSCGAGYGTPGFERDRQALYPHLQSW